MKASDFHNLYGDVVPLDVYTVLTELDVSEVKDIRYGSGYVGDKNVYRYSTPPTSWNIPSKCITNRPVRIESNSGSFFLPHKDLIKEDTNNWLRLNCFLNNAKPEECTYIIDGVIQQFEERRWYTIPLHSLIIQYIMYLILRYRIMIHINGYISLYNIMAI